MWDRFSSIFDSDKFSEHLIVIAHVLLHPVCEMDICSETGRQRICISLLAHLVINSVQKLVGVICWRNFETRDSWWNVGSTWAAMPGSSMLTNAHTTDDHFGSC